MPVLRQSLLTETCHLLTPVSLEQRNIKEKIVFFVYKNYSGIPKYFDAIVTKSAVACQVVMSITLLASLSNFLSGDMAQLIAQSQN